MSSDLRHQLGRHGEDLALAHLERLGLQLVTRNYRTSEGEIDLIALEGSTLVFVEVKTRRGSRWSADPWESLHERKRSRVRSMATLYLREADGRPSATELRFDAIGVVIDARGRLVRLSHLEAAF